jgi:hypothetical protein
MLRVNLTIAIVAMVVPTNKTTYDENNTAVEHVYECYSPPLNSPEMYLGNETSDATKQIKALDVRLYLLIYL